MGVISQAFYWDCPKAEHERCVVGLMNAIYRALVPGGSLLAATSSTDGRGAFQDPTHCSFGTFPIAFGTTANRGGGVA